MVRFIKIMAQIIDREIRVGNPFRKKKYESNETKQRVYNKIQREVKRKKEKRSRMERREEE